MKKLPPVLAAILVLTVAASPSSACTRAVLKTDEGTVLTGRSMDWMQEFLVMTNSPEYAQQLALNTYWQSVGGNVFLPGTSRASDRFARAWFGIHAVPRTVDPDYIKAVPGGSLAVQAVASVMSVIRSVSVPLGISTPGQPNIASTIWRTVADSQNLVYYYDSATVPNTFWVELDELNLAPGSGTKRLQLTGGKFYSGETSKLFEPAEPFTPLTAKAE